jgi:rod shape-determining protein MreB and related proteins
MSHHLQRLLESLQSRLPWLQLSRVLPASFFPVRGVAIDLGTGNTLIYVKGEGVILNEPSVVAVERATGRIAAVGHEAKSMLGRTPDSIRTVRPLRDGVIADVDVTEAMMRHFLTTALKDKLFRVRPRMVIGVPSGMTELERRAVRTSATAAGAREVYMLPEPVAAAIGVGLPIDTPRGSMVIDIGGGTTEIAVIALNGIVADTSIRVGGDEIDEAIMAFVRSRYGLLIGEPTAEAIKIRIGSAMETDGDSCMDVKGRDMVSGVPKTVEVCASDVRECMLEPIRQIVTAVKRALEMTPPELSADIMDSGIVMTGGGALIRGLDKLIERETGLTIHVDSDPLTCVARGAAAVLDDFEKYRVVCST